MLSTSSKHEARTRSTSELTCALRSGWGELTDLGKQSTLTLGKLLRDVYVNKLGLVSETLQDLPRAENPVLFRSTAVPRAIESLHSVVAGLFPVREGPAEFVVRQPADESLYPNSMCQ